MSENQQQYKALALFSLLALTPSSFVISSYTITSTAVKSFCTGSDVSEEVRAVSKNQQQNKALALIFLLHPSSPLRTPSLPPLYELKNKHNMHVVTSRSMEIFKYHQSGIVSNDVVYLM